MGSFLKRVPSSSRIISFTLKFRRRKDFLFLTVPTHTLILLKPHTHTYTPTHMHAHTNSRWGKSLIMGQWHSSRAPPQMPARATLQPGLGSSSENREAAAPTWLWLKSQLYSWPPASSWALRRGAWPRKQLSPHLGEEAQPPQPPPHTTCSGGQTTAQFLLDPRGRAECWLTPRLGAQHSLKAGTSPWTAQGPQTCWGIRSGLGVQVTGSHQIPNQALEILYRICLQGSFSIQKAWLGGDTRLKYCPRMGWAGRSLLNPSVSRKPLRTTEFWKQSARVTGNLCCPLGCHEHCLDSLGLQPTFPAPS